jgi:hypothetical protein
VQSIRPADGILAIEELGANNAPELLEVKIGGAQIVRVWRDPSDPSLWRERPTNIYRWPVGTFVVVIGRATHPGRVQASRIEIPKVSTE